MSRPPGVPRRDELLQLIAEGMSNKSIAHVMGVTENTVKAYASWLMVDLECENRTELARHYWQNYMQRLLEKRDKQWEQTIQDEYGSPNATHRLTTAFKERFGNDYAEIVRREREDQRENGAMAGEP